MAKTVTVLLVLAFLIAGVGAPGTAMLFVWPAVLSMAVAGVAGLLQLRQKFNYRPSVSALWAVTVLLDYIE